MGGLSVYVIPVDGSDVVTLRHLPRPVPSSFGCINYRSIADHFTEQGTPVSEALVGNMIEEYVAYRDLITKELKSSAPVVDT